MNAAFRLTVAMVAVLAAGAALAQQVYYEVPLRALKLVEGRLPRAEQEPRRRTRNRADLVPRVVADAEAEAYLAYRRASRPRWLRYKALLDETRLHARGPKGAKVTGHLYLPHPKERKMVALRFEIPTAAADAAAEKPFLAAKESYYRNLRGRRIPGTAWFRHQERSVRRRSDTNRQRPTTPPSDNWNRRSEFVRTYALFTGGRAVSENLQLDRVLPLGDENVEKVPLDSIRGITVEEMDWDGLTAGLDPKIDPLAKYIPADQHVVFFPSFSAAVRVADVLIGPTVVVTELEYDVAV